MHPPLERHLQNLEASGQAPKGEAWEEFLQDLQRALAEAPHESGGRACARW